MKKCLVFSIFLLSTFTLTGCRNGSSAPTISSINNLDGSVFEYVDSKTLYTMEDMSDSFIVFVGNEFCSICEEAKAVIGQVASKQQVKIYAFNYVDDAYTKNIKFFNNISSTPSLVFISTGNYISSIGVNDITNTNLISRSFSNYKQSSSISTLYYLSSLSYYSYDNKEYLVFINDKSNEFTYKHYATLYSEAIKSNKPTLILSPNYLENKDEIYEFFNVSSYKTDTLAFLYSNGITKTVVNYTTASIDFSDLLTNYYRPIPINDSKL